MPHDTEYGRTHPTDERTDVDADPAGLATATVEAPPREHDQARPRPPTGNRGPD